VEDPFLKKKDYKGFLKAKLDSLKLHEKLESGDSEDTAKVMIEVGKAYGLNNEPKKELEFATKALSMLENVYEKEKDNKKLASCLTSVGAAYGRNGDFEQELSYKVKAAEMFERLKITSGQHYAECLKELGQAYSRHGDHKKELEVLVIEKKKQKSLLLLIISF
jgi:tetratricopeptide (TPR) repeat protein